MDGEAPLTVELVAVGVVKGVGVTKLTSEVAVGIITGPDLPHSK
jgi:hypothetical protein